MPVNYQEGKRIIRYITQLMMTFALEVLHRNYVKE